MTVGAGDGWIAEEWQAYCDRLLSLRHGEHYQRVPDESKGDGGIEGYARGTVYQCYAAELPYDNQKLYRRQRDKLVRDVKKFENNAEMITHWTSPYDVSLWILLVPEFTNKDLLTDASNEAKRIRHLCLKGVGSEFDIVVHTDEDYAREKSLLLTSKLPLSPDRVDIFDSQEWLEDLTNVGLLRNLRRKLGTLQRQPTPDAQAKREAEFIQHYLTCQRTQDRLRRFYPDAAQTIRSCVAAVEGQLTFKSMLAGTSQGHFSDIMQALAEQLDRYAPELRPDVKSVLVVGTLSEWLLECNLEVLMVVPNE